MMKKVLTVLIVLLATVSLVFFCGSMDVSAETSWDFDSDTGTLTISGTGDMKNYNAGVSKPWDDYKSQISKIVIENGVTSIGTRAFIGTTVKLVEFPDSIVKIGDSAFANCTKLYRINMPDSITEIGSASFSGCSSLAKLKLSENLAAVPESAFSSCTALTEATIPASVKSIGSNAFSQVELQVTFNEGLESIGERAFPRLANSKLVIPDSVTYIGYQAFYAGSNITEVVTGRDLITIDGSAFCSNIEIIDLSKSQNLKTIGDYAFSNSKIRSADIPNSVTSIGTGAFNECKQLTEVKLPQSLSSIGEKAFYRTAITSIDIPEKTKQIGVSAFSETGLKKIAVPHSVTNVYSFAFSGCKSLTAVDISGFNLTLGSEVFRNITGINHVHVSSDMGVQYYIGRSNLPTDAGCFFEIGADGKCPAAHCPFRDGGVAVGDVNNDGKLNNTDIILLGRSYMAGDSAKYIAAADMNNDGKITNTDIILLGRLYMSMQ